MCVNWIPREYLYSDGVYTDFDGQIPKGTIITYGEIAESLGSKDFPGLSAQHYRITHGR